MLPRAAALTCYSLALPDASELYEAMRTLCPRYVDLSALDDDAAAARVRADGVDVLVHLVRAFRAGRAHTLADPRAEQNGYTAGERSGIFARRPAVVQLQTKGYMASMGAPFVPFTVVGTLGASAHAQPQPAMAAA